MDEDRVALARARRLLPRSAPGSDRWRQTFWIAAPPALGSRRDHILRHASETRVGRYQPGICPSVTTFEAA